MSKVKTKITFDAVKNILEKNFTVNISNLEFLKGGEISQAFSFEDENQSYIVKIRKVRKIHAKREPFQKEINAFKYITSRDSTIPIPKVLKKGFFLEENGDKYIYCISEKADGSFTHNFPEEKQPLVDMSLVKMLFKIHNINISTTSNYGHWKDFDKADFSSWKDFILEQIKKSDTFIKEAIKSSIFNMDFLEQATLRIKELLPFCTNKRYIVHADYGFDNTLADENGNITAIFDWEHSIFGDFVYDIAWLDFWEFKKEGLYAKLYRKVNQKTSNLDYTNFNERLLCYKLFIGIEAVSFFIDSEQKDNLLETLKTIQFLLET